MDFITNQKLIHSLVISSLKQILVLLNELESYYNKMEKLFPGTGFVETYEIMFLINKQNVLLLYNHLSYDIKDSLFYFDKISYYVNKKQQNNQTKTNQHRLFPSGMFIWPMSKEVLCKPTIWLNFIDLFYKKFCKNQTEVVLLTEYNLLLLRSMFRQAPKIFPILDGKIEYLFVGYTLNKALKTEFLHRGLHGKYVEFNDYSIIEEYDGKAMLLHALNHIHSTSFKIKKEDILGYYQTMKLDIDVTNVDNQFEYVFLVPKTTFPLIIPLLFRLLIESALEIPMLITDSPVISLTEVSEYNKIVSENFEEILYYLLTTEIEKSLIIDMINYKK